MVTLIIVNNNVPEKFHTKTVYMIRIYMNMYCLCCYLPTLQSCLLSTNPNKPIYFVQRNYCDKQNIF